MIDKEYIKGFFDGEGTVGLYTQGSRTHHRALCPELRIFNTCLPVILTIKEFFDKNGYHCFIKERNLQSRKTMYELCLKRWGDILRFINTIGTNHPDKQAIFERIEAQDIIRKRGSKKETIRAVEQMLKLSSKMI